MLDPPFRLAADAGIWLALNGPPCSYVAVSIQVETGLWLDFQLL